MAALRGYAIVVAVLAAGPRSSAGAEPVRLRERAAERAAATRVVIALKADGQFLPHAPTAGKEAEAPRPLDLKVETRLDFAERLVAADSGGRPARAVRWVNQAAVAINGDVRPTEAIVRPDVALLLAERHGGDVVIASPSGPLTRPELDMLDDVADPLLLPALLPEPAVAPGGRWKIGGDGARALTGYDVLAANALEATLERLDDDQAEVTLRGTVRGATYGGGEGTVQIAASLVFDRKAELIRALTLQRDEARKPGEIEDGLNIKSTLTVKRTGIDPPPALADAVLKNVPDEIAPDRLRLVYLAPDGRYRLEHDRDWHLYQETVRQTVLKRLDHGEVIAYCNVTTGPDVGAGRHQDLRQFRDDIRRALGERFGQLLGEGEVEGDPAGGFRYKVAVQGRQGKLGVVWNYFLAASPRGHQLLITFTLAEASLKAFGDQDLQVVGSLRWNQEAAPP